MPEKITVYSGELCRESQHKSSLEIALHEGPSLLQTLSTLQYTHCCSGPTSQNYRDCFKEPYIFIHLIHFAMILLFKCFSVFLVYSHFCHKAPPFNISSVLYKNSPLINCVSEAHYPHPSPHLGTTLSCQIVTDCTNLVIPPATQ